MKKLFSIALFVVLFLMLLNQSCTKDIGAVPEAGFIPDTSVKYQKDIVPLLTTYCYGQGSQACHVSSSNQGSPGDFSLYAPLKAYADDGKLKDRALVKKDMPPSYSSGPSVLSASDYHKFKSWIVLGAQNN